METLSGLIDLVEQHHWARHPDREYLAEETNRKKYSAAADRIASVSEMKDCFDIYENHS